MPKGGWAGIECLADEGLNRVDVAHHQHGLACEALLELLAGGAHAAVDRLQRFAARTGDARIVQPLLVKFRIALVGLGGVG